MSQSQHDEKVTVDIDPETPLVNVGRHPGGEYNPRNNTTVFKGNVKVDAQTAEDLRRRQTEYRKYERDLIRDNGSTGVHVQDFTGN